MKIVGIRFQNLNSLKGTHEIRFDKSPFLESGLFAITGPTGAGKTTILDAITVALYGRVHRHDRDTFEIMTRHTSECYAEVEFEVKKEAYRAKWALRRSRGKVEGKLQDVKMELSRVDTGLILESKLTEVKVRIVELTGLDYNQFLRSVMLSQGDFTRFLKANESDRSELLEKITDTGIYSEISVWAYKKSKSEKEALDNLRNKLNDVELLSSETEADYREQLQELHEQELSNRETKQHFDTQVNWLRNIQKLQIQKEEAARQLTNYENQRQNQQPQFYRLQQHEQAIIYKPALTELQSTQKYTKNITATLENLKASFPAIQTETLAAAENLQEAEKLAATTQLKQQETQPILEKVIQLDATILNQRHFYEQGLAGQHHLEGEVKLTSEKTSQKQTELHALNGQILELQNWLGTHEGEACLDRELDNFRRFIRDLQDVKLDIQKKETEKTSLKKQSQEEEKALAALQENIFRLQKLVTEAETAKQNIQGTLTETFGGKTLEELESSVNALPKLIGLCEQQVQLSEQYIRLQNREAEITKLVSQNTRNLENARLELQEHQKQQTEAEAHLKDLQNLVELEIRVQKYEQDRDLLQPGTPCPLCGSEHHPFALHSFQNRVSDAEEKRNAYQLYISNLTIHANTQTNRATSLETKITSDTELLKNLQSETATIIQKFGENNISLPKPLDILKPAIIQAVCQRKQQELDLLRATMAQIRGLENELKGLEQKAAESREAAVRAESAVNQTTERITGTYNLIRRVAAELLDLREQETHFANDARSFLQQFGLEFDFNNRVNLEKELVGKAQKYIKNNTLLRDVELKQNQTATEFQKIQETLTDKIAALENQAALLEVQRQALQKLEEERRNLFGNKNPTDERAWLQQELAQQTTLVNQLRTTLQQKQEQLNRNQEQQTERKKEQEGLEQEINELTKNLSFQLQAKGISSIDALVALFITEEEAQQIANLRQQLEHNLASAAQILQHTETSLQQENARALTIDTEQTLQQKIQESESKISLLNREIGRLEQLLRRDAELKTQYQSIAGQIEVQHKEFLRWDKLAVLIGSADGKKFSKFAQGLTLARLVALANQHLKKINERYYILKNPEQDLDLQIVDTYQADAVRPMSTLSGGESFLVSLALALGLSDLAGRQTQINSLFIDEGFGTLDADTLELAITSLENLQASGKMIGIISHVEALKERISTQIQVIKMSGGASRLKVVGHATDAYV